MTASIRSPLLVAVCLVACFPGMVWAGTLTFVPSESPQPTPADVVATPDGFVSDSPFRAKLPRHSSDFMDVQWEGHSSVQARTEALVASDADGRTLWHDNGREALAEREQHVVSYVNRFAGVNDVFTLYREVVKHDTVLVQPLALPVGAAWVGVQSTLVVPRGLRAQPLWMSSAPDERTAFSIEVRDAEHGGLVYTLEDVIAFDANGNQQKGRYRVLERSNGRVVLLAEVPVSWLETAAYPVRIDPTFTYTHSPFSSTHSVPFHTVGTGVDREGASVTGWNPVLYQMQSPTPGWITEIAFAAAGAGTYHFDRLVVEIGETTSDRNQGTTPPTGWSTTFASAFNAGNPSITAYDGPLDVPFERGGRLGSDSLGHRLSAFRQQRTGCRPSRDGRQRLGRCASSYLE